MSDFCQVCNRELPHPKFMELIDSGQGDCIGAIVEALATMTDVSDYGYNGLPMCIFCTCASTDANDHIPSCLWYRAKEAMKK